MMLRQIDIKMAQERQELEGYGTIPVWLIDPWESWPNGLGLFCLKCGYTWTPGRSKVKVCPQCKRYFWNGNWPKIVLYSGDIDKIPGKKTEHVIVYGDNLSGGIATDRKHCPICNREVLTLERYITPYTGKIRRACIDCYARMRKEEEFMLNLAKTERPDGWEDKIGTKDTPVIGFGGIPKETKEMLKSIQKRTDIPKEVRWVDGQCSDCKIETKVTRNKYNGEMYCQKCNEAITKWIETQEERLKKGPSHGVSIDKVREVMPDYGVDEDEDKFKVSPELKEEWHNEATRFNTDDTPDLGFEEHIEDEECSLCKGPIHHEVAYKNEKGELFCQECNAFYKYNGKLPTESFLIGNKKYRESIKHSNESTPV